MSCGINWAQFKIWTIKAMCILMRYGEKFSTNEAIQRGRCLASLINSSPYPPSLRQILETLIHISYSDQHIPGGLGLELSNIID